MNKKQNKDKKEELDLSKVKIQKGIKELIKAINKLEKNKSLLNEYKLIKKINSILIKNFYLKNKNGGIVKNEKIKMF